MAKIIINKIGEIQEDGSYANAPDPIEIIMDPTFIYWIEQSNPDQVTISGGISKQNPSSTLTLGRMWSGAKPPNIDEREGDLGPTFAGLLGEATFEVVNEKSLEPKYILGDNNDAFLKNQSQQALDIAVQSAKANGEGLFEELLYVYFPLDLDGWEKCKEDVNNRADKATAQWMDGYAALIDSGSSETEMRGPLGGVIDISQYNEEALQKKVFELYSQAIAPIGGCGADPEKRRILNYRENPGN